MGYTAEQTVEAIGCPEGSGAWARPSSASRSATPRARSASSAAAGWPARRARTRQFPVQEKVVFLLLLIAGFNFFIGVFNFIPLLPLDGGHIASALWEASAAGSRGCAVAPTRASWTPPAAAVAYVDGSFMLVMSLVLIVGDFVVPLHLQT